MNARESLIHAIYPEIAGPGADEMLDEYRAEVLHEAAAELDRIADTVEAAVAKHYGPASGIGPGSAQMLRDAAGNVRYMARKDTRKGESTTAEVILPDLGPEESCTGIALNCVHTQVFHCRQTTDAHELHLWRTGLEWFTCRGEAR